MSLPLKVTGLEAVYGRHPVVHGVDLAVAAGQALCVVGPNGSGKSSLLQAIFGLVRIRAGRVEVGGRDVTAVPAVSRLRDIGMAFVLQESSVFPDMTVAQNLVLGGHTLPTATAARQAADRLMSEYPDLAQKAHQRAGTLSGGERRRLEIIRALMTDPAILLADEPSIGLAPKAVAEVFDLFDRLRDRGKTILLVEQNTRAGLGFADLGSVLVAGRVVRTGAARDLLADPAMAHMLLGVHA